MAFALAIRGGGGGGSHTFFGQDVSGGARKHYAIEIRKLPEETFSSCPLQSNFKAFLLTIVTNNKQKLITCWCGCVQSV